MLTEKKTPSLHITVPLQGKSTGDHWIPLTRASNAVVISLTNIFLQHRLLQIWNLRSRAFSNSLNQYDVEFIKDAMKCQRKYNPAQNRWHPSDESAYVPSCCSQENRNSARLNPARTAWWIKAIITVTSHERHVVLNDRQHDCLFIVQPNNNEIVKCLESTYYRWIPLANGQ